MSKLREYFWVPEGAIFDSAADATEFMDLGAGTLVANHVFYDELQTQCDKLLATLKFNQEQLEYIAGEGYSNLKCYQWTKEAIEEHLKWKGDKS
jgi:hypothetical protein